MTGGISLKKIILLLLLLFLLGSASIVSCSNCKESKELDNLIVLSIKEYYEGVPYIYTYNLKTEQLQKITKLSGYNPVWTKEKQMIVFNDDREYDPSIISSPSTNSDIYVINRDGTDEKRITDNKVSYDPDVNKIRSEEHTSELQSRPHLVCR